MCPVSVLNVALMLRDQSLRDDVCRDIVRIFTMITELAKGRVSMQTVCHLYQTQLCDHGILETGHCVDERRSGLSDTSLLRLFPFSFVAPQYRRWTLNVLDVDVVLVWLRLFSSGRRSSRDR
jgi:hypothetical protein